MTAKNCYTGNKAKQIRIYVNTRKSVFVYCKLNPVPFKPYVKHKAENTDEVCNCSNIHNTSCHGIKLVFEIKTRFCVHTVKYKKAYQYM